MSDEDERQSDWESSSNEPHGGDSGSDSEYDFGSDLSENIDGPEDEPDKEHGKEQIIRRYRRYTLIRSFDTFEEAKPALDTFSHLSMGTRREMNPNAETQEFICVTLI